MLVYQRVVVPDLAAKQTSRRFLQKKSSLKTIQLLAEGWMLEKNMYIYVCIYIYIYIIYIHIYIQYTCINILLSFKWHFKISVGNCLFRWGSGRAQRHLAKESQEGRQNGRSSASNGLHGMGGSRLWRRLPKWLVGVWQPKISCWSLCQLREIWWTMMIYWDGDRDGGRDRMGDGDMGDGDGTYWPSKKQPI